MIPNFYKRLQKFSVDGQYVVDSNNGNKNSITRQPADSRTADGGLKIGEMDKDCLFSHGTPAILSEKFYDNSDGYQMVYCKICGYRADTDIFSHENFNDTLYKCKVCKVNAHLVAVDSTWTFNVFQHIINGMNIDIKLKFEQPKVFVKK